MPNEKNRLTETAIYDKLFREISPVFLTVFAEKVLGLDIVEYSELKDKLQITRQKETDSLRKARDRKGDTFRRARPVLQKGPGEGYRKRYRAESYEFVRNLIQSTEFDDAKIASLAVVEVTFVKKVRADLGKKKK